MPEYHRGTQVMIYNLPINFGMIEGGAGGDPTIGHSFNSTGVHPSAATTSRGYVAYVPISSVCTASPEVDRSM